MIKRANLLLDKLLRNITNWVIRDKYKIVGFLFLTVLVVGLSFLPYLNLLFTKKLVVFVIFALLFAVFRLGWRVSLYFSIILFVLAFAFTLVGLIPLSQVLGDYIYGFLVLIAIEYFIVM
ncbi:MAG: hypothetical protein NTV24_04875 [Candidatus Woesebacteria bacterium]|nr:hypothetical protein [Candidatus Woesebacteria bacterium]